MQAFLKTLLPAGADVAQQWDHPVAADEIAAVGVFTDDHGSLAGLVLADLAAVNRLGAALTMIPATAAEEAYANGAADDQLAEFFQEVINVIGRLYNSADTDHVVLAEVRTPPGNLNAAEQKMLDAPAERADFRVTADGYGDARLALLR